jgi:hypothetical protein
MQRILTACALAPLLFAAAGTSGSGEKEFKGTITALEQSTCKHCNCVELTATLRAEKSKESVAVRLGPRSFFAERDFLLSVNDSVEIIGVAFEEKGKTVVLANEVRKAGERILLRGKHGRPQWIEEHGHTCPMCAN